MPPQSRIRADKWVGDASDAYVQPYTRIRKRMEGGGVQWGGFNEDAADYPIRKFSLHFDRARRAASNKDDSHLPLDTIQSS